MNMKAIGIELFMELLYSIVVYEYLKTFFQRKNVKGICLYIWGMSAVLQITEKYVIGDIPNYVHLITGVLSLLCVGCFFMGSFWAKVVFSSLYMVIAMLCEVMVANVFFLLNISINDNELIGFLFVEISIMVIVKAIQHLFGNETFEKLPWTTNVKLMILPIGSMFLVNTLFNKELQLGKDSLELDVIICIISIFVLNFIVFYVYTKLCENLELKYKTSIYEKEFELMEQSMHERELIMDDFRRMRHDLKNQMISLLQLLEQRKYNELEQELVELTELKVLQGKLGSITDNSIVDTVVNYKKEMAKNEGIDFSCNINVPIKLPFNSEDLCVILGNVLDNAIEASTRGSVENPFVSLEIMFDGMNLIVVIENKFDGKVRLNKSGNVLTRKRNIKSHGIGLYSVRKILEIYNGEYDTMVNGNIYRVEIILHKRNNK